MMRWGESEYIWNSDIENEGINQGEMRDLSTHTLKRGNNSR